MTAETISSNGFSVDMQLTDVVSYLECEHPEIYAEFIARFPEWVRWTFGGGTSSWFDTEQMGVDPEWSCWCIDWIEGNSTVTWWEGEPWTEYPEDPEEDDGP